MTQLMPWICFNLFVLAMLALDLGVFHRHAHRVSTKESAIWSAIWVAMALSFGIGVNYFMGTAAGLAFFGGYLIEKALSVDNIFVFLVILTYFKIPEQYQHRILFVGIISALILRGAMIAAGLYLIHHFHWITYVFGVFLIFTGIRLIKHDDTSEVTAESNRIVLLVRRFLPTTETFHGQKFFVKQPDSENRLTLSATPMFVALIVVEFSDVMFALDSIPAVMAITQDSFIVYTSNVFAILGLRSLYFLLAGAITKIKYLNMGLACVLTFIGIKMLINPFYKIPILESLCVIATILGIAIVASLRSGSASPPDKPVEDERAHELTRPGG